MVVVMVMMVQWQMVVYLFFDVVVMVDIVDLLWDEDG